MKKNLEIHLHTNYSCNLNCVHCYNESGINRDTILPKEFIITLFKMFYNYYQPEIHLEGGEIFLRPDFLAMMNELPDEVLKCITITTNGTICLKEEKILSMLRRSGALRISVEGNTNEQQRAVRGVDIDKVLTNAKFYLESGVPVWLRVTLNKINYEGFVNFVLPALQNMGFFKIQVYEFQKVGRGSGNGTKLALEGSISDMLNDLITYSDSLVGNIKLAFPRRRIKEIKKYELELNKRGYQVHYLEAGDGISIHADGEIFLCAWDNDNSHSLGNILKMETGEFFDLLNKTNLTHDCEYCSAVCIRKQR